MTCLKSCGVCCGIFSVFAVVFLIVVGAILNSGSEVIDVDTQENRDKAAKNCWIGAAIYAGFFVVSLVCYFAPVCGRNKDTTDNRQRLMAIRQEE